MGRFWGILKNTLCLPFAEGRTGRIPRQECGDLRGRGFRFCLGHMGHAGVHKGRGVLCRIPPGTELECGQPFRVYPCLQLLQDASRGPKQGETCFLDRVLSSMRAELCALKHRAKHLSHDFISPRSWGKQSTIDQQIPPPASYQSP